MKYLTLGELMQPNKCTSVWVRSPNNRGNLQTNTLVHRKIER